MPISKPSFARHLWNLNLLKMHLNSEIEEHSDPVEPLER